MSNPSNDRLVYPSEPDELRNADIAALRALSMEERGRMIQAACRAAAEIYRSRLASGLGDVEPAPWPASTLEFLRSNAPNARRIQTRI